MNNCKKVTYVGVRLLATGMVMHRSGTGRLSLKFVIGQSRHAQCSVCAGLVVTAEPEDSLGDGPGNR